MSEPDFRFHIERLRIGIYTKDPAHKNDLTKLFATSHRVESILGSADSAEVLRWIQTEAITALITDISKPKKQVADAIELIETLRSSYRNVPVCLAAGRQQLVELEHVPLAWRSRFAHYFVLDLTQSDALLAASVQEVVFRLTYWILGRRYILLTETARDEKFRNTAFVMTWMDPSVSMLEDILEAVKGVFESFGVRAIAANLVEHSGQITEVVREFIAKSDYLLADLTGERPNVYYEVGYAHALGRLPILVHGPNTRVHFDLAGHNVRAYKNATDLRKILEHRLQAISRSKSSVGS